MIATTPAMDIWAFQSKYKQSVSDYFKKFPAGNYSEFLAVWPRAYQIGEAIFKEVYIELQKRGAIRMIEGGKAHAQFLKDLEEKIRREKTPAPTPAPVASTEAVSVTPSPVTPEPTTNNKGKEMAKVYKLGDLTPEERKEMDLVLQKTPNLSYDDFCAKLGYILDKMAWYPIARRIKQGSYDYPGINGFKPKGGDFRSPRQASAPVTRTVVPNPTVGGAIPLVNYSKINGQQIIGAIDTEGKTPEMIKVMQSWLPTVLCEILHRSMQFKVVKYTEEDPDTGREKVTLEVRRIA